MLELEGFGFSCDNAVTDLFSVPKTEPLSGSNLQQLASTIESSIIPRLLVNHGLRAKEIVQGAPPPLLDAAIVDKFVRLVMSEDNNEAVEFVESLLSRGLPQDVLLLDLFAPSARLMGEMWTADLCSFVDVTLGLSRMQQLLRRMNGLSGGQVAEAEPSRRGLLVPCPGEQHTFGLRILEEFLIRDGWDVRSNLKANHGDILQLVEEETFQFIGLSLSGETLMDPLVSIIREVRQRSQNRSIRVIVGGVIFVGRPDLVRKVGADSSAIDAREAVRQVNSWVQSAHMN